MPLHRSTLPLTVFHIVLLTLSANAGNVPSQYRFRNLKSSNTVPWVATAISDLSEGQVVVVGRGGFGNSTGVRWTQAEGDLAFGESGAFDVSGNGSTIVGGSPPAGGGYRWTAEGADDLNALGGGWGLGVSRDGKLVVGFESDQPYLWDADNPGAGLQLIENFELTSSNTAFDVGRDSAGNIWSVGATRSPSSGTVGASAIVWRNGMPHSIIAAPTSGAEAVAIAMVPASPGSPDTVPLIAFNTNQSPFNTFTSVARLNWTTDLFEVQKLPNHADPSHPDFDSKVVAADISTNGQIVVGSAQIMQRAMVWELQGSAWSGLNGAYISDILAERLLPSDALAVDFAAWSLQGAAGVTKHEEFVPTLGTTLVTSMIAGNGRDPNNAASPWLAAVYAAPDLVVESLVQTSIVGGTFEPADAEWTVSGDGVFEAVASPAGGGLAGQLTTETQLGISQLVDTPDAPFVVIIDLAFLSSAGSAQLSLDGVLVGEWVAADFNGGVFQLAPTLIAEPELLGRHGIELRVTALGGSTGQILVDNVSFATAIPEPTGIALMFAATCYGLVFHGGSQPAYFGSFFNSSPIPVELNDSDQVAFAVDLVGDEVNEGNDRALFAQDISGLLRLIAREGDELEVRPGELRTIGALGSFEFNNRGQVAFAAEFTDGSEGIFISNLVAVPEPAAFALALTTMAAVFGTRQLRLQSSRS